MPRRDRLLLLIPTAALLAILPLLLHGPSCGHDFDFHLLSWQEAARQFAHGNLHPRWAFTPAWGAGEPRFVFYPPLSWTLGALLTLAAALLHHLPGLRSIAPAQIFAAVPIAYTWLALTLAGFAMHHLARRFVPAPLALLAALLYMANPYTLFTTYERAAFAELLAASFLPILLAALLPLSEEPGAHPSILHTTIPLALLWLTNAPAAVIGSYTVALVVLLRIVRLLRSAATRRAAQDLSLRTVAATALALALACFYIVPAVLERPWVSIGMAILPGLRPDDNTLFHHTPDSLHDAVLLSASHLALLLVSVTAAAIVFRLVRLTRTHRALPPDLLLQGALTLAIALLLTPVSLPVWHHLPELAFLQFPWRLLALLAPLCALSLVQALGLAPITERLACPSAPPLRAEQNAARLASERLAARSRLSATLIGSGVVLLLLAVALIFPAYRSFHQTCDAEDTPQARYALFRSPAGEEPTDEYTPTAADNDVLKDNNPAYRLLPESASDDTPSPPNANPGAAPLSLDLDLPAPTLLVINLRDYPTWSVTRNGFTDPDRLHRADGLLTLDLPAGSSHLAIFQRTPVPEYVADAVSLGALLLTLVLALRQHKSSEARDMIKTS